MRTSSRLLGGLVVLCAGVVLVSGGVLAYLYLVEDWAFFEESVSELKARQAPVFTAKREQLKRLVANLPPVRATPETQGPVPFDPPLGTDPITRRYVNYTGAMDYECLNPEDRSHVLHPDRPKFWTSISGGESLVQMASDMRPLENDFYGRKRATSWARRCDDVLARPYFVIVREGQYTKPIILPDQKAFAPGHVALECFVYDLRDDQLRACVRVEVKNQSDKVWVGRDVKGDGAARLTGELAELALKEMQRKFKTLCPKHP